MGDDDTGGVVCDQIGPLVPFPYEIGKPGVEFVAPSVSESLIEPPDYASSQGFPGLPVFDNLSIYRLEVDRTWCIPDDIEHRLDRFPGNRLMPELAYRSSALYQIPDLRNGYGIGYRLDRYRPCSRIMNRNFR